MNDAKTMDFDPGRRHADRKHFIHHLDHDRFESGDCFPDFFRLDSGSVRNRGHIEFGLVQFDLDKPDGLKQKLAIPLRGRRKFGQQQRVHDGNAGLQLLHDRRGHTLLGQRRRVERGIHCLGCHPVWSHSHRIERRGGGEQSHCANR